MRCAGFVVILLVACGEGPAAVAVDGGGEVEVEVDVEYRARGATFIAVRSDNGPWQGFPGDVARFTAVRRYEVAVACLVEYLPGWSVLAAVGDEAYTTWCAPAEGVAVDLDVTGLGRADVYIGETWISTVPPVVTTPVAPGTYDVAIMWDMAQPSGAYLLGAQILRDVIIEGPRRLAIDLDAHVPLAVATVEVDGEAIPSTLVNGRVSVSTRRGSAFMIYRNLPTTPMRILPDALLSPGDEQLVLLDGIGDGWAEAPIGEAPLVVDTPRDVLEPGFAWEPVPYVSFPLDPSWAGASFQTFGEEEWLDNWTLHVTPGALSGPSAGRTTLAMNRPEVEGWDPAWMPDRSLIRSWKVTLSRPRAAGGREGISVGGRTPP